MDEISEMKEMDEKTTKNDDSPFRKYLLVFILSFSNLLNYADRFIVVGILASVKEYYNLSNGGSGMIQTVLLVSYTIFSILFGILGDHFSRKWLISFGLFVWSCFTLLGSFVPKNHAWLFFISRSMVGIGEASLSTLAFPMVGELFESGLKRTTVLSIYLVALPIGTGIGIIIGPIVAEKFGWRYALRVTPFFSFLCGILTALLVKEKKNKIHKHNKKNENTSQTLLSETKNTNNKLRSFMTVLMRDLKFVFGKRAFISCTLAYSASSFATGGITMWAITFMQCVSRLKDAANLDFSVIADSSHKSIGSIFGGSMLVCGILGVFCGGEFSRLLRNRFLDAEPIFCAFCNILSAIPLYIAFVIASYNELLAWILFILAAFVMCFTWTPNSDLLFNIIESEHRALATAIQILCMHLLGDALSPAFIGFISDSIRVNNTVGEHYRSLCISLLVIPFILVLSGILYMFSASNYIRDKKAQEKNSQKN